MTEFFDTFENPEEGMQPDIGARVDAATLQSMSPDPDGFADVLTQVTLDKGELLYPKDQYAALWNMYFVNREWYHHKNNGLKLSRLFPAFVVAEFKYVPFLQPGAKTSPEHLETYHKLVSLFSSCYLVLPFKHVRHTSAEGRYGDRACHIDFVGARFNLYSTARHNYVCNNEIVMIRGICAYGYFQVPGVNLPGEGSRTFCSLASITAEDGLSLNRFGGCVQPRESTTPSDKILEVFQACEHALLGERLAA